MSSTPTIIGNFNATPLNQNFGDHALGKLGKRRVEQSQPPKPRSVGRAFRKFGNKLSDLGTRFLNTITPKGVRADIKFRRGLASTSKEMGNLLGALSSSKDHPVNEAKVRISLAKLPDAMSPVTRRGGAYDQVFSHRLDTNLERMTPKELGELLKGVNQALQGPLGQDQGIKAQLETIQRAVQKEVFEKVVQATEQAFTPVVNEMKVLLENGGMNTDMAEDSFVRLKSLATDTLRNHGLNEGDALALVKEGLQKLHDPLTLGGAPIDRLESVMTHLTSDTLKELRDAPKTVTGPESIDVAAKLVKVATERQEAAEATFKNRSELLLTRETVAQEDLSELVLDLHSTAASLTVINTHGPLHGLEVSGEVEALRNKVSQHVGLLLEGDKLDLSKLSHREIQQLNVALKQLGIEGPQEAVASEIARRITTLETRYAEVLLNVVEAASAGDHAAVLETLKDFRRVEGELREEFTVLGRKLDDSDARFRWRAEMAEKALSQLTDEQLRKAYDSMQSTDTLAMVEALTDAGSAFAGYGTSKVNVSHSDLSNFLNNLGTNLGRIKEKVEKAGASRNLEGLVKNDARLDQKDFSLEARTAIREVLGIEFGPTKGVRLMKGTVPDGALQTLNDTLEAPRSGTEVRKGKLDSGEEVGVSETFYLDMLRGMMRYEDENGIEQPFYTPPQIPENTSKEEATRLLDEAAKSAVNRVKEYLGGDEELLWAVSQYVNQGTAASFQVAMASPIDGFVRLEDGQPVLLTGVENKNYVFSKKPEGGVKVSYHQEMPQVQKFYTPGSKPENAISDQSHMSLDFALDFSSSGEVRVEGRPTFEYSLKVSPWTANYPQPRSIVDVLGSRNEELQFDIREHAQQRQVQESLHFLEEYTQFAKAPTLEGARALARKFVARDAPEPVNIDDEHSLPILNGVNTLGAQNLTGEELTQLFSGAYGFVCNLLDQSFLPTFVATHTRKLD